MAANRNLLQAALHKPYDRLLFAKEVLSPVFQTGLNLSAAPVPASAQPNKSEQAVIHTIAIYGTITLDDGTEIICYEITLQPTVRIEQSKVAIQRYVRKLLVAGQAALVNFVAPQNKNVWRLTLVAKDSELTEQGVKEKITHAKRYTYLLGPSETCKTAAERFEALSIEKEINFQTLINAFSVEKLSKVFFDEYTLHYQKFCNYLQESNFRKSVFKISIPSKATQEEKDKLCKPIRDFVKKHLGRIVFLYFVQKKGWLGSSNTDYKDGLTDFIKKLFTQSGGNDSFYPSWLSVLFFDTLNKERANDDFKMPDGKKVKVPFLNGGLFDKEEYDEAVLTIPAKLFHNADFEDTILTEKNGGSARGFLDFLDAFNFTVHEDSPDDHTVAVDPEMLGHIFENLLEDNKDKGAFYTPKEIVHYMCQESLTEYLTTQLNISDEKLKTDVAYLVKRKEISDAVKPLLKIINEKLDTVKICDPAIGSGAFPMGLLQEIQAIKEVIAFELEQPWKPAEVKENIIQNSIYGVDIEKGAVDIARLRFWLSLVVDEEKPRALPNLDYKIVVGDSLVSKFEGEIIEIDWDKKSSVGKADAYIKNVQQLLKDIAEKQRQFFKPDNKNKKRLHAEIRDLKLELLINQLSYNKAAYENKTPLLGGFAPTAKEIKHNAERDLTVKGFDKNILRLRRLKENREESFEHFDWKLDFPEVLNPLLKENGGLNPTGFDIVIGNPPYVQIKQIPEEDKVNYINKFKFATGRFNLFYFFIELTAQLGKNEAITAFIIPDRILLNTQCEGIREWMLKEQSIVEISSFDESVFENAVVDTIIMMYKNVSNNKLFLNSRPNLKISDLENSAKKTIPFSHFESSPNKQFDIKFDEYESILISKLRENSKRLGEISETKDGIIQSKIPDILFLKDQKNKYCKPLLFGKDINRYELNYDNNWVNYQPEKMMEVELERNGGGLRLRKKEIFERPKILTRQTSDRIIATIDYNNYYYSNTLHGTSILDSVYDLKYLLAILNSKVIDFYYKTTTAEGGKVFAQIKIELLRQLPIKYTKNQETFISLVDKILSSKQKNPQADTTSWEREIDIRVYHLYNLSFDEAKLIDKTLTEEEFNRFN